MWRRSFSRPGCCARPCASQRSRDWPPFQARVVKPRISTLTEQRSSVLAVPERWVGQLAAFPLTPGLALRANYHYRGNDNRDHGVGLSLAWDL